MFLNLVLNGVQAMPEGGELSIVGQLDTDADAICVEVADTGVGIRQEHLATLFDPWLTLGDADEGLALGLPVSHSIVRRHGGRLAVQSTYGLGTTFGVYLPVAAP